MFVRDDSNDPTYLDVSRLPRSKSSLFPPLHPLRNEIGRRGDGRETMVNWRNENRGTFTTSDCSIITTKYVNITLPVRMNEPVAFR